MNLDGIFFLEVSFKTLVMNHSFFLLMKVEEGGFEETFEGLKFRGSVRDARRYPTE